MQLYSYVGCESGTKMSRIPSKGIVNVFLQQASKLVLFVHARHEFFSGQNFSITKQSADLSDFN